MSELFVSYKREDADRVATLVQVLRGAGFNTFWDQDIPPGANWQLTLEAALDAAQLCVVVWTRSSAGPKGHFVREEARRAARRGAYLGVLIDPIEPPLGFGEWQAFNVAPWDGNQTSGKLDDLIEHIRARLDGVDAAVTIEAGAPVRASMPAPDAASRVRHRGRILGGAAAATAALLLIAFLLMSRGQQRCEANQNELVAQLRRASNEIRLRNDALLHHLNEAKDAAPERRQVIAWWGSADSGYLPRLVGAVFNPASGLEIADEDGKYMSIPVIQDVIDREGGSLKNSLLRLLAPRTVTPAPDAAVSGDELAADVEWLNQRLDAYTESTRLRIGGGCGWWSSFAWSVS